MGDSRSRKRGRASVLLDKGFSRPSYATVGNLLIRASENHSQWTFVCKDPAGCSFKSYASNP